MLVTVKPLYSHLPVSLRDSLGGSSVKEEENFLGFISLLALISGVLPPPIQYMKYDLHRHLPFPFKNRL